MRSSPILLGLLPVLAIACSDASSSAPASNDSGTGDDGSTGAFTYTPAGCSYSYAPPSALDFQDLALDDTGAVSATNGVPQRVRVGLGGGTTKGKAGYADPTTSAAFTWETAESNHAAKVKLGTSASSMSTVQTGYTWTLKPSIGSGDSYFHEVHACGLKAGTTYFYQVGGGPSGKEVWSATQSFTTVPSSGSITFGVFGDARDKVTTWQAVHERMKDPQVGVAMSLIDGDVVDIGGEETLYGTWLDAIWKDPNNAASFLTLGQMPILAINGNHENDVPTSFANWALPGEGDYAETYASFDAGNTHFTMIDDQQISGTGALSAEATAQLAWVDQDLAAADGDRSAHPFVVVMGHRGVFSTSLHAIDGDVIAARGRLAPIYDKHHVDLVINGHDHEYERTVPITAGSPPTGMPTIAPAGTGTTYVICAGAGADPYAVGTTSVPYRMTKTAFGSGTPYIGAYSLLTMSGTTLTLKAYGLKASSSTVAGDDVIDTVTLSH